MRSTCGGGSKDYRVIIAPITEGGRVDQLQVASRLRSHVEHIPTLGRILIRLAIRHQNGGPLADNLVMHTTDMHLVPIAELLPELGKPFSNSPIRGRARIEGV